MAAVLSLVPAAQFSGWQWLSLALAAPVALWGGWPLHRSGWLGLRRGVAPADLLASLAILAALGWSAAALLLSSAGALGARQPFAWTVTAAAPGTIFLSAAAGLTVTALTARYLAAGQPATPGARPSPEPDTTSVTLHPANPDPANPDPAAPDPAGRDQATPDLATPDLATPDLATPDLATPDPATPDPAVHTDPANCDPARCGPADGSAGWAAVLGPCVIAAATATLGFWLGAGLPAAAAWGAAIAVLAAACPAGLAVPAAARSAAGRARADLAAALGSAAAADAILADAIPAGDVAAVADATLAAADPRAAAAAVDLARVARAVERASLRWAVGYNVIVVPVAALGYLSPLLAGLAMAASTAVVLAGGRRLRTRAGQ